MRNLTYAVMHLVCVEKKNHIYDSCLDVTLASQIHGNTHYIQSLEQQLRLMEQRVQFLGNLAQEAMQRLGPFHANKRPRPF